MQLILDDHNGPFGSLATEYNDSAHLVCACDRYRTDYNHSVHLVCACDRYRSEYNDSVDHLACFQGTFLPTTASLDHRTTRTMFAL